MNRGSRMRFRKDVIGMKLNLKKELLPYIVFLITLAILLWATFWG
jgi:hypothetical protein